MANEERRQVSLTTTVITAAGVILILAGIRTASSLVVPFLLSGFMATLVGPVVFRLHRWRIPKVVAILLVMLVLVGSLALISSVTMATLEDINSNLPEYQEQLQDRFATLTCWLNALAGRFGFSIDYAEIVGNTDRTFLMELAGSTLMQFGTLLTKTLLVILTTLFMLLEAFHLPEKVAAAFGRPEEAWAGLREFAFAVQKYIAIKTATSLATGFCATLWLWLLDVDYAVFWGLVAFLLNYIPNIGSVLAAVPAVLMGVVQHGGQVGIAVALGYLAINVIIGSITEPKFMGDGVGLSPLVVFMSLVFWGWMLGGVGMLLSTPLTISVRIALGHYSETRWIATMIGSGKP